MDLAACPLRLRVRVSDNLNFQLFTHTVDGMVFIGVHLEQAFHFFRLLVIHFNQPPAINPDIPVSEGRYTAEQSALHSSGMALPYIQSLLFRGVAGEHGQLPPHHSASRTIVSRLAAGDERNVVFRFQPFKFNVVTARLRRRRETGVNRHAARVKSLGETAGCVQKCLRRAKNLMDCGIEIPGRPIHFVE